MTTALAHIEYKPTELDTNSLGSVLVKSMGDANQGFQPNSPSSRIDGVTRVLPGRWRAS